MTIRLILTLTAGLALTVTTAKEPHLSGLDEAGRLWVEQTLNRLTTAQKIGQLIVATTRTSLWNLEQKNFREVEENILRYQVGGYHAFRGKVFAAAHLIDRIQRRSDIPLLITADLEGGAGLIFEGATRFPKAMALSASGRMENVYRAASIAARESRRIGVTVSLAPVVDVNNNPRNPIINIRSFGEEPDQVASMASAYIRGLQDNGLLATAKHFPGHGDTEIDSHLKLPVIGVELDRLRSVELPPFQSAIEEGVDLIMTAHISIPALEERRDLPATLSKSILTDLLRDELGFEGLIITDAMNMGGVSRRFRNGEAAVRALEAGADVILFPPSVKDAFDGLSLALRSGRISLQRVESSVRRILSAKARLGLHREDRVDLESVSDTVGTETARSLAQSIMDSAVTLVRDQQKVVPFNAKAIDRLLLLTFLDERQTSESRGEMLVEQVLRRVPETFHYDIAPRIPASELEEIERLMVEVDAILAAAYIRVAAFDGDIDLSVDQLALLRQLGGAKRPVAFLLFGSPYLLSFVPELPSYILMYDDYPGAELSAVRAVFGEIPFRGRLPVSLPGYYQLGHGIIR